MWWVCRLHLARFFSSYLFSSSFYVFIFFSSAMGFISVRHPPPPPPFLRTPPPPPFPFLFLRSCVQISVAISVVCSSVCFFVCVVPPPPPFLLLPFCSFLNVSILSVFLHCVYSAVHPHPSQHCKCREV